MPLQLTILFLFFFYREAFLPMFMIHFAHVKASAHWLVHLEEIEVALAKANQKLAMTNVNVAPEVSLARTQIR